ncbi:putative membrane protein [Cytobacillus eiseniae]|uniref:Membrane protein n=1 Tax=Cytobacillus eiseniae TaxID=762947 RepID=A0ABS4REP9_9BACI|nr:phage holin family protein [Cytobacillus eiseniae]MBP2240302.1 putative membrane protein [Cytobacillus eiseniae]
MRWIVGIIINAVLFVAIAGFSEESFYISSFGAAIGASFILSILNILVRPVLIILTLPVTLFTLGFFLFVINAITLQLTDRIMGSSFEIASFGTALLVAIVMSIANLIIQKFIFDKKRGE